MDSVQRLEKAVGILRSAGIAWDVEPVEGRSGQGLGLPDGSDLATLRLLAPSSDPERVAAAAFIEEAAATLGIRFTPQIVSPDALDYAVLSSGDFDAAVLGWRVPEYPGFMCEWFEADRVFNYSPSLLPSLCGQLNVSSDLEKARDEVLAIQEALVMEVPLIPLFRVALREELQGVAYPFESLVGGLVGVYGAPELALPTAR
jgi:ABC-type transport system substrate-binding protein